MKTPEEIMVSAAKPLREKALGTETLMKAAVEALDAAGYVIVPKKATRAMTLAAEKMGAGEAWAEDCYSAMLAVKP